MTIQKLITKSHIFQPVKLNPTFGYSCLWCALQSYNFSEQKNEELLAKLPGLHSLALFLEETDQMDNIIFNKELRHLLLFGKVRCQKIVHELDGILALYEKYLPKKTSRHKRYHCVVTFSYTQEDELHTHTVAISIDNYKTLVFDPHAGAFTLINPELLIKWTEEFYAMFFESKENRKIYSVRIMEIY